MSTREDRIVEMIQHAFNQDGRFQFRCTECGKCCKNRSDILMTPFDLNRIARHLDIPMGKVIQDYCIWYVGESSRLPVVTMKMQGPERICPFLKNRRCGIHTAKPTVCALFPLGRIISDQENAQVQYILQDVDCGAGDQIHTAREWMEGYGLEESEAWFIEWQKVILPLAERMNGYGPALTENLQDMVCKGLLAMLYVNYSNNRDFMVQFRENAVKADEFLNMIDKGLRIYDREGNDGKLA